MAKPEIVGAWFNTGYHGHKRNIARPDFINEFRYLAKPQPPQKFVARSQMPMSTHPFSSYECRNQLTAGAVYIQLGLGRRRFVDKTSCFDKDFLSWFPVKPCYDTKGSSQSTYQGDYHANRPLHHHLVDRPATSFDKGQYISSYRYAYGTDQPNREAIVSATERWQNKIPRGLNTKPKFRNKDGRETVASCLSWHTPRPPPRNPSGDACGQPSRRMVPKATEISAALPSSKPSNTFVNGQDFSSLEAVPSSTLPTVATDSFCCTDQPLPSVQQSSMGVNGTCCDATSGPASATNVLCE